MHHLALNVINLEIQLHYLFSEVHILHITYNIEKEGGRVCLSGGSVSIHPNRCTRFNCSALHDKLLLDLTLQPLIESALFTACLKIFVQVTAESRQPRSARFY